LRNFLHGLKEEKKPWVFQPTHGSTDDSYSLAISRQQWADFGVPKPIKFILTAPIKKTRLIHLPISDFWFYLTQPKYFVKKNLHDIRSTCHMAIYGMNQSSA
jgi:hypothetical protein